MATPAEQRALVAIRAGATDEDAAAYAAIAVEDLYQEPFATDVASAKAELAIYATTVVRQALGSNPALAQRYLDRIAAEREVRRFREISEGAS